MNKILPILEEFEEPKEDPLLCGHKKISGDLDIRDRDRNPLGGLKSSAGFQNRNNVEMDFQAQEMKDEKKREKIAKGTKSNKC